MSVLQNRLLNMIYDMVTRITEYGVSFWNAHLWDGTALRW